MDRAYTWDALAKGTAISVRETDRRMRRECDLSLGQMMGRKSGLHSIRERLSIPSVIAGSPKVGFLDPSTDADLSLERTGLGTHSISDEQY